MPPRRQQAETILIVGTDERFVTQERQPYLGSKLRLLCVTLSLEAAEEYLVELGFEKVVIDSRFRSHANFERFKLLAQRQDAEFEVKELDAF